jgi:hypothetical protein
VPVIIRQRHAADRDQDERALIFTNLLNDLDADT